MEEQPVSIAPQLTSYSHSAARIDPTLLASPSLVLLVSGLHMGGNHGPSLALSRQSLFDFVAGRLGSDDDKQLASRICRCNSIMPLHDQSI